MIHIADWKSDEWCGLADLLANLIEKYTADLEIDSFPDPSYPLDEETVKIAGFSK